MFFKELIYYLTYLSPLVLIFGIVIGNFYFTKISPVHRVLFYYLIGAFLIDVSSRILGEFYGNNLIFIPIFGFVELALFSILYYSYLLKTKQVLLLFFITVGLGYILFEIWNVKNVDSKVFQTYSRVVDAFIIVLMSILFYLEKMKENTSIEPSKFALNTAVLIYFSLHLIFFLPINFLINESSELKFYFWSMNLLVTLSFYLFLIHSIWKNGKIQK